MVEQSLQGAINVVQFSGPLRGDNVAQVSAALAEPMRRGQPAAVLDLRKVTLMDSAALEMLVEMQAGFQWRGGCLKLTSPNRLCEEILAITGVAEQFEFHSDVGKAVGELRMTAASQLDAPRAQQPRPARFMPLGEHLLVQGLLTQQELDTALASHAEKGSRLGEALLELGFVSEAQLLPFMAQRLGVRAVGLRDGLVDPLVVRHLPREVAEAYNVLPTFKVAGTLTVAMSEPTDLMLIDELARISGCSIRPVFAFSSTIQRVIPLCYEGGFQVDSIAAEIDDTNVQLQVTSKPAQDSIEDLVDGSPIINLANYLIVQAIRLRASDIHIEPGRSFTSVRFRVDGQLREAVRPRLDIHPPLVSRIKVMAEMNIAEHHQPQDGRFQVDVDGRQVDIRVSTLPTVLGEKVVMRILDRERLTFSLDQLGIPADMLVSIEHMLAKPHGLLLVTGPTGSGKTTTLYSALELIKSVQRNIVTVEDPVEYQIELVNQVQVAKSRELTFASALRSILRQDPDVVMIGEIRDGETAKIAIEAALTGHLVLSTLHTNDTSGAITRLVDMGVDSFKVAACLGGVIAQRLVRTICPDCRTFDYPTPELIELIDLEQEDERSFVKGAGCDSCFNSGYQGRIGIYETLPITRPIRDLISAGATPDAIRDCHRAQGGTTLLEEGLRCAEAEKTSLEEVVRVAFVE